jgi:hypothetical protein
MVGASPTIYSLKKMSCGMSFHYATTNISSHLLDGYNRIYTLLLRNCVIIWSSRQHGYRYVYRYPADTDTSIHHFLKQSNTWIRLNIFSKNNTVHMRYKIKENKQQYSMRTHFKGFKHDP